VTTIIRDSHLPVTPLGPNGSRSDAPPVPEGIPFDDDEFVCPAVPRAGVVGDPITEKTRPVSIRVYKGEKIPMASGGFRFGSLITVVPASMPPEEIGLVLARQEGARFGGVYSLQAINARNQAVPNGEAPLAFPEPEPEKKETTTTATLPPEVSAAIAALTSSVSDLKTQLAVAQARAEEQAKVQAVAPQNGLTEKLLAQAIDKLGTPPPVSQRDPLTEKLMTAAIDRLVAAPVAPPAASNSLKESIGVMGTVVDLAQKMNPGAAPENPWIKGAQILVEGIGNFAEMLAMGKSRADALKATKDQMSEKLGGSPAESPPAAPTAAPGQRLTWVPQGSVPPAPGTEPATTRQPGQRTGAPHAGPSPSSSLFDSPPDESATAGGGHAGGIPSENRASAPKTSPTPATNGHPVSQERRRALPANGGQPIVNPLDELDVLIRSDSGTPEQVADLFFSLVAQKKIPRFLLGRIASVKPEAYPAWAETLGFPAWGLPPLASKLGASLAIVRQRTAQAAAAK
jgi:hypothetical protein